MVNLITFNLILLTALSIFIFIFAKKYSRELFSDISNLFFIIFIISPSVLFILNIVYLYFTNTSLIYVGFIPLIIPLGYFTLQFSDNFLNKKKFNQLNFVKELFFKIALSYDINSNSIDISIRLRPKNHIDVIIKSYPELSDEILNKTINELKNHLNSRRYSNKYSYNFYLDEKKSNVVLAT